MKQNVLVWLLILALPPCLLAAAPSGSRVRRGLKALEKRNFERAGGLFARELRRNPASAAAKYGYALYFFDTLHVRHHLDSSYRYVLAALADYPRTSPKTRRQWKKWYVSDSTMQTLKLRIDSLGFAVALGRNREADYQLFLDQRPTAPQKEAAVRRRNALAFAEAQRANTYESYKRFLERYPDAEQTRQVTEISELVLYESQTRDGTPESYVRFAAAYPRSPYRQQADRMAFDLLTAPHTLAHYRLFTQQYPENTYAPRAWAWLLFLYAERQSPENFTADFPDYPHSTDLLNALKARARAYFPVYEEDKYGFLDSEGQLRIPPAYDSTANSYFCEGIQDDFILAYRNGKLGALDKTGRVIADFTYEAIDELEKPLLRTGRQGKQGVVHEAGFEVLSPRFDSVEVLNERFLKTSLNGRQGLTTMNGLTIFEPTFEEVTGLGEDFVRLRQNGRFALLSSPELVPHNGREVRPAPSFQYQKAEWVKPGFVRIGTDRGEAILDAALKTVVAPQETAITALPGAWLTRDTLGFRLWSTDGSPRLDSTGQALVFERVIANERFYGVKYRGRWGVLDQTGQVYVPAEYDSLTLVTENIFLLTKKKNTWLHTAHRKLVSVPDVRACRPQPTDPDSASGYLTLENRSGKWALYTRQGRQLLPFGYESIRVLGPNLFVVESGRTVTLRDSLNRLRVPSSFDGLSPLRKAFVATLKNRKFGVIHPQKKLTIAPQYESLLQFYDREGLLFIARKNGRFGLVDRTNREKA
ncbi:MAG: WG repeat-containing protein, partial [Ferruginibacter sp.]|nr:WG repeat-containing protein [Cytophagales bacterium]